MVPRRLPQLWSSHTSNGNIRSREQSSVSLVHLLIRSKSLSRILTQHKLSLTFHWIVNINCNIYWVLKKYESEVTQSCPTLCDPMDCSLPDSSIHGIFQARVLEWVAIKKYETLLYVLYIHSLTPLIFTAFLLFLGKYPLSLPCESSGVVCIPILENGNVAPAWPTLHHILPSRGIGSGICLFSPIWVTPHTNVRQNIYSFLHPPLDTDI